MRLERAFLLEQLNKHMEYNIDDSDRSSSPPPTPTDKPLRSKRSHNRKATPPPGAQHQSPPQHPIMQHAMNPMSSAQSTPDASRMQGANYFGSVASPHGVNGAPVLPPLHSLPPLQPLSQQRAPEPARAYFDPAYDTPAGENEVEGAGRRRAYSGAQQTPQAAPQNGDTEMADAGATVVYQ